MSHPPVSLQHTVRSHCKGSVLNFCNFFLLCTPLSGHQCILVCKVHSDKIPAKNKDETMNRGSIPVRQGPVVFFTCTQWCHDWVRPGLSLCLHVSLMRSCARWWTHPQAGTRSRPCGQRRQDWRQRRLDSEPAALWLASPTVGVNRGKAQGSSKVLGGGMRGFTPGDRQMVWLKSFFLKKFLFIYFFTVSLALLELNKKEMLVACTENSWWGRLPWRRNLANDLSAPLQGTSGATQDLPHSPLNSFQCVCVCVCI
jgi:hypothetical protein